VSAPAKNTITEGYFSPKNEKSSAGIAGVTSFAWSQGRL
jgi:hypothetical protein